MSGECPGRPHVAVPPPLRVRTATTNPNRTLRFTTVNANVRTGPPPVFSFPLSPFRVAVMAMPEPHEFSRPIENLIADLRGLPGDQSRSKKRQEQPLGTAIDKLLHKYHIGKDAPDHTIRQHWAEIVGNANAAYSHPVKIDGKTGKLLVQVTHAVVRDELRLLETILLQRVRQLPDCERVTGLTLRAG